MTRAGMQFVAEIPAGAEVMLCWVKPTGMYFLVAHPDEPPFILKPDGSRAPVLAAERAS